MKKFLILLIAGVSPVFSNVQYETENSQKMILTEIQRTNKLNQQIVEQLIKLNGNLVQMRIIMDKEYVVLNHLNKWMTPTSYDMDGNEVHD